ncbi:MAG: DUF480 domain-containing protein, partial [Cupriavidus sp.]|nr:DUF480 domain-containing protein [Cupriavidus sp.]
LLSGEASAAAAAEDSGRGADGDAAPSAELEQLRAEQQALTEKVARLQGLVEHMAAQLGISADEFLG